ncbi:MULTISPECIES: hypothetical protein [Citrobacter]|uniref:Uncharacterized protein n=2 Tax=Enterobacteriaceae TaxID=543 RepID=A0ABD5H0Z8_9ENTR|nr:MULTISPECIES: hypothetical protein [Citrobacter freundii complex]MBJ8709839.1 hypothetical protein [Citrobacter freundii]MBJ9085425.1 hypothetical protein [Citrobacter freundii]MBJ9286347.1 hypothetical protein [Citrobacter freundii]MCY3415434.1 hypothetical protein [Citrobacter freundii]MDE9610184.1 hypothetical protein [Citrobacter portucalensis]
MNTFIRRTTLKIFFLLIIMFICVFSINSVERYNNIVSFNIHNKIVYTLEKMKNDSDDDIKFNVYSSRLNWVLGQTCFSENIELQQKGEMELYNWGVGIIENETITLKYNGRELIFSVIGCNT